jgi:TRAP-type C4-dicarboxylate transport system substrate-binding protein
MHGKKRFVTKVSHHNLHLPIILAAQKWNKISEDMQAITRSKTQYNGKMCNDKWNYINSDYKKIFNYHKSNTAPPIKK